jgi:LysR family transcriptional activator of nhaA
VRDLNYNHLYYFWRVAREGGVARAAALLHLTPQTVSGQLRALEQALGGKLFARAGRRLALTDTGRLVLDYADDLFRIGAEMKEALEGRAGGRPLAFTVGVVDAVPKMIAYRLLEPALRLREPVRIVCREGKLEALLAELAVHKLDIVLADSPLGAGATVRAFNHLLGECGVAFFAARKLAASYRRRFPKSLDGAPLLLPATNTAVRGALTQWLERQGVRPRIAGEFEDSALMKAFGQAGVGAFIVTRAVEREVVRQYDVRPIGRTDEVRERFYAISAERKLRHPAVVAVTEAARLELFPARRANR